ncbi:MAG: 3-dehydroquinate synthase [Flavobacteriaceae bacterium]|nr:3-dehydroquinate synthase [Flavobacteriaceae bacterium]
MPVSFGLNTLKPLIDGRKEVIFLCDENTAIHCLPLVSGFIPIAKTISIHVGEQNKTIETCNLIWAELLKQQATRNAILICIGGGVVTDLGGFCAATFKRGIDFVLVPTSLLGMVDAAIGGKTGINVGNIKNSVGLFANPIATIVDDIFLNTLPQREAIAGMAEMLKHGLIADVDHWHEMSTLALQKKLPTMEQIQASIHIKETIVAADPTEQGQRKLLNFGHTIGHAIEAASLQTNKPLLHGEAVAWGMVAETALSLKHTSLSKQEASEIVKVLTKVYVESKPDNFDEYTLLGYMQNDKKRSEDSTNFTLLQAIGNCVWDVEVAYK